MIRKVLLLTILLKLVAYQLICFINRVDLLFRFIVRMYLSYVSYIVVLLTALASLNVSRKLLKRSIPYFSPKKQPRCSIASMCRTSKALEKILKKQSKAITEQGKEVESKFKGIEKTLMELSEKVAKLTEEVSQQVRLSIHISYTCQLK